ncbi:28S ribosomal protein S23, mitochondrial [Aplysia californica]|uniref:Small ribosomal subunit protein mS23 n=1 Tax=Aplysia californica TaxID=6500 RepID=A0ABM0JDK2_APLCA|nr:28S ribosomal protein S23, mitochondrial [Aplysia californica]
MAGSRRESVGSILTRLQGLLRAGAMKAEDRPIWYDIVKAKPPKPVPPHREVQKILYPEDFVRARFYKTYADPGATVLSNENSKSIPQKFVDRYLELHGKGETEPSRLFEETTQSLAAEGVRLITHEERAAARGKSQVTNKSQASAVTPETTEPGTSEKVKVKSPSQKVDIKGLFDEKS